LGGFKSGCTSNLVVANGVLNAPDYTRTCSCSYQNQTSLALIHMPNVEVWSVNALANAASGPVAKSTTNEHFVESVGFNLGAAGDRRDQNGVLWLEYPVKAGISPPFKVEFNKDAKPFTQHAASRREDPLAWITSSGVDNLKELTLGLKLVEEVDLAKGIRISHADDDAEETETGNVDLSSSDLEMTDDDGKQTIGLRFESVPLPKGTRVREAYLQFTCDEASKQPTSLSIAGELAPNAERFSATAHDISSRTKTAAKVLWSPPAWTEPNQTGLTERSPDLSHVINEIIEQTDWQAGNAMAFVVEGEGQRVAVASKGSNKEATKLVVVVENPQDYQPEPAPSHRYEVELIFAPPRGSTEERVFDVYAQEKLVASNVEVLPGDPTKTAPAKSIVLPSVAIEETLKLRFEAKRGTPTLSGVRLDKTK